MINNRGVAGSIQMFKTLDKCNCVLVPTMLHKVTVREPRVIDRRPCIGVFAIKDINDAQELRLFNPYGHLPSTTFSYKFDTIQVKGPYQGREYVDHMDNGLIPTPNYNRRRLK